MYLLDTNTIIYFFKDMGNVANTLLSKSPQEICIPAIALFELNVGVAKSNNSEKRQQQLERFLKRVEIISFGRKEAQATALIRADLEKKGLPIGPFDTLIAGTAMSSKTILVTHNTKEFLRIAGLQIEDWY